MTNEINVLVNSLVILGILVAIIWHEDILQMFVPSEDVQ